MKLFSLPYPDSSAKNKCRYYFAYLFNILFQNDSTHILMIVKIGGFLFSYNTDRDTTHDLPCEKKILHLVSCLCIHTCRTWQRYRGILLYIQQNKVPLYMIKNTYAATIDFYRLECLCFSIKNHNN